jgi:hypothetical protein
MQGGMLPGMGMQGNGGMLPGMGGMQGYGGMAAGGASQGMQVWLASKQIRRSTSLSSPSSQSVLDSWLLCFL